MKVLNHDFTAMEKFLLVVLGLILFGAAYILFVHTPLTQAMSQAESRRMELQMELETMRTRLSRMEQMRRELERIETSGTPVSQMPAYNSSSEEIALLNGLFSATDRYSVQFAGVTRNGDLIRRGFSLQFATESFTRAREIITQLTGSPYRCLLNRLNYSINTGAGSEGRVIVSVEGIFYETLVDGTPDIALSS